VGTVRTTYRASTIILQAEYPSSRVYTRPIFKGEKILSTPSFGGEVKPSVPCRQFTACKRTLKCNVEVDILGKITGQFLAYKTSTFRCLDLSRRVGRGDIWRRKWERLEQHRASTISLQAAVHPAHMLRALITKKKNTVFNS